MDLLEKFLKGLKQKRPLQTVRLFLGFSIEEHVFVAKQELFSSFLFFFVLPVLISELFSTFKTILTASSLSVLWIELIE